MSHASMMHPKPMMHSTTMMPYPSSHDLGQTTTKIEVLSSEQEDQQEQ
jgi:hypothetical protein